ncbi:MAG: aminoacetone oxidase family FAD-binding enzyme, partial [Planctomycetes bacterium]|nr:aminoacetone oxidase family FAD-binding enzyme [Planctomycetota bacterium]
MAEEHIEIAVLGAGAAGLLAATRAAELGRRAVLFEKNRRAGVKILISGGTRCNLTHDCDARGIVEAFGENGKFLRHALAALPPAALRRMFEDEGVPLYVEPENGKVFPVSDRAQDVLAALLRRFGRSGARLELNAPVTTVERAPEGFRVVTGRGAADAAMVILTTGGKSYASVGTTGDGYRFAAAFGHRIVHPRPALVPLASRAPWVAALAGVALADAEVRVVAPGRP